MLRSGGVDEAWELGSALRCLREQNILIIGSGMATHNLSDIFSVCEIVFELVLHVHVCYYYMSLLWDINDIPQF